MVTAIVGPLGRWINQHLEFVSRLFFMGYLSTRATLRDQTQGLRTVFAVTSAQIYFTGIQALPLMAILALATGSIVILQSSTNLHFFGGVSWLGQLLVVIVVRELGPLITALVVIARSGTAVASEVGNMRANREIEALEIMGINPLSYIVFPRLVGGVISLVCLSFYFTLIALLGGFVVTFFVHDLPFSYYLDSLLRALKASDGILFLTKNLFSGLIIFTIACYQGLSVRRSPTEVPVATTGAVVKSIIAVVVFNLVVTLIFYMTQLMGWGLL